MYKCLIIEDELESLNLLLKELENYSFFKIKDTADSIKTALEKLQSFTYDLVFADIQLKDGLIFNLFEQLDYYNFEIIFITSYDDYILKALRLNAIDYLLKPIDKEELRNAINNFIKHCDNVKRSNVRIENLVSNYNGQFKKIVIPTENEYFLISIHLIEFLESAGSYTIIYTSDNNSYVSSKSLGFFEELLKEYFFLRIHQQFIVNLKKVSSIYKNKPLFIKLQSGKTLPVTRFKKSEFIKLFLS
ncbi:MAG: LytTR family DNA-binding domain-containing protein [Bacteroidales bacterium]|nr:LytTR family DNA-binding domain-containing protein [Bacteroidales bacterium]